MARATAPKSGVTTKTPQTKRTQRIAKGAPDAGGSGADKSPYSSARGSGKGKK